MINEIIAFLLTDQIAIILSCIEHVRLLSYELKLLNKLDKKK
jgi:hypothetical protein